MHVPLSPDLEMYMLVCNLFEIISMPLGLNHLKHLLEKITYHNLFLSNIYILSDMLPLEKHGCNFYCLMLISVFNVIDNINFWT